MISKWLKTLAVTSSLLCSMQAWAGLDYGDAPAPYGEASHADDTWQRLGEDGKSDDGVSWSVSKDGGLTWSDYATDSEIEVGDQVKFSFAMNRSIAGDNHYYDQLKAWVDWNQDGVWSEDEVLLTETWYKWHDDEDRVDTSTGTDDESKNDMLTALTEDSALYKELQAQGVPMPEAMGKDEYWSGFWIWWELKKDPVYNSNELSRVYSTTEAITIDTEVALGDIWLRARVVCSESIMTDGKGKFNPTGYYYQGEVEDYLLTIKEKEPPTDIPEPAGLAMLLSGLGLIAYRQRRQKKA